MHDQIQRVGGDELVNRCKPIWGLNNEGEINGVWRDLGIPNMWYIMGLFSSSFYFGVKMMINTCFLTGNFALCRFHTSHVALRKFHLISLYPWPFSLI